MNPNTLTTKTYLNTFSKHNFYILEVDGRSLEDIVSDTKVQQITPGLVPTLLNWLWNPEERAVVWSRVLPPIGEVARLPILMCSEDVCLSCTLIIVEVQADNAFVYWRRFGRRVGDAQTPQEHGQQVLWYDDIPSMKFKRSNYEQVLEKFRRNLDVEGEMAYPAEAGEVVFAYGF